FSHLSMVVHAYRARGDGPDLSEDVLRQVTVRGIHPMDTLVPAFPAPREETGIACWTLCPTSYREAPGPGPLAGRSVLQALVGGRLRQAIVAPGTFANRETPHPAPRSRGATKGPGSIVAQDLSLHPRPPAPSARPPRSAPTLSPRRPGAVRSGRS